MKWRFETYYEVVEEDHTGSIHTFTSEDYSFALKALENAIKQKRIISAGVIEVKRIILKEESKDGNDVLEEL